MKVTTKNRSVRAGAALLLLSAALALAGCQGSELPCPAAKILRDADEVTHFIPGQTPGPKSIQYLGQITAVKLACSYDPNTLERLDVALGVKIEAHRNAAAPVDRAALRYFVGIVNLEGQLLAKKEFPLTLAFPAGQNDVTKIEEISQTIPLSYPQNGGSLQIWVGFQLTDAQLEYNRARKDR